MAQWSKFHLPSRRQVWSLGQEDLLKEEMATQSSILAWKIQWTEEPGGLQSLGSQLSDERVGHNLVTKQQQLMYWLGHRSNLNVHQEESESERESCSVVSNSLWPHGLCSPWNSPGHDTGVGSLSLLQGIFPTQGSNPGLLQCKQILYQLSHKGSPINRGMGK